MSDDPAAVGTTLGESPDQVADMGDLVSKPTKGTTASDVLIGSDDAAGISRPWNTIERLYERHADNLRGYLRKLVGSGPPDPDDVVQAAFDKLSKVGDFNDIKNPHAFLWRTAQNIVTSEHRSSAVRERHVGNVTDVFYGESGNRLDPERVLLAEKELSEVVKAISAMTESRRCVLLMHRIDGMSLSQIGDKLGISGSAARKRLVLAMAELHRALGNE